MELYYKDLISEDATLESLVDDLTRVVQGADEFTEVACSEVGGEKQAELKNRLARLKTACQRVKGQIFAGAVAADTTLHEYPYSTVGFAFSFGIVAGALAGRLRLAPTVRNRPDSRGPEKALLPAPGVV